ncbi:jg7383, partial [Pararge aegeria aegeria]
EETKVKLKFPFECHLCFKGFNFEAKLKNHMFKHSPSRGPYKCSLCSMHLPTAYSASVHSLTHTLRYECVQCGRRMLDRLAIVNHYRYFQEETKVKLKFPFECHLCFKGFNFEAKLKNHMFKHSPSRGPYKCSLCSMHLPTAYSASVHSLTHTLRYECVQCGRRMLDRLAIVNHYRSQHEGVLAVFTCHLCGKVSK